MEHIDTITQNRIIESLSEKLRVYYVFPEVAGQICERLAKRLQAGEFTGFSTGETFAAALTNELQAVNHDKHLRVRWFPQPLPEHDGSILQNPERAEEFRQ